MVSMVPLSQLGAGTSDEGNGALDYTFCFFIEVEPVGSDSSVESGLIEETFDHFEESTSRGEVVAHWPVHKGQSLADDVHL